MNTTHYTIRSRVPVWMKEGIEQNYCSVSVSRSVSGFKDSNPNL